MSILVNRVGVLLKSAYAQERSKSVPWSKDLIVFLLTLGTILAGLGVAYLIVSGDWLIAITLVFAIPVFITLHRFPFITLIIWLVLSPFLVQTPTAAQRQVYWLVHRFLPVLTLGILVISSNLRISKRYLPRFDLAEYAMLAYVVATVFSIILQNDTVAATLTLFYDRTFIPMCLYWVIKLSAPGEKSLKWLVPVALYIVMTQVTIGTLSWFAPSLLPSVWLKYAGERTTGSLNSVSVFTTTLIFAGAFLLYSALRMKPGWKRNFLILAYLSTIYAIFISFSRASWLVGILVLLGILTLYPRFIFRLMLKLLPIILLLAGTFLVSQLQFAKERLYSENSTQTALSRLPVVVAAYRMFEAKPIFGWGYNNFNRYDRQFQGRFGDLVNPDEKDLTSHNMYLTLLAEQGLVGLILVLTPIFWLLFRTLGIRSYLPRSGLKSRNMIYLLWLVVLSYFIVNNLAPMVVVFGLGLYWITLGLISNILQTHSLVK
jgi:O-antigen ligase